LLGAWLKARQERSEKFRDRTIEASVEFLQKHDAARKELQAAQNALFSAVARSADEEGARKTLSSATEAWRDLQTQGFLVSLLLPGGLEAPAAQDVSGVSVLYYRWRNALYDFALGRVNEESTREIVSRMRGTPSNHTTDSLRT
jgi:hypothetical protein